MEKIKLNPIIILIAIVIGVYIGFSTKKQTSHYVNHSQQKQVLSMVNEVTESYFVHFVKIPYSGSDPEKAGEWVISKLPTSFNFDADEKTTTKIGPATLNIYGTPLMRFLEIDFGYY